MLTTIGFAVDSTGDIVVVGNQFQMVGGDELTRQKVQSVLGTNLREWFFDQNEGINFSSVLGKGINKEIVQTEVENGLAQVDETFQITELNFTYDPDTRTASVRFNAKNSAGQQIGGDYSWH